MNLPEADRLSYTKQYCISRLASVFGGREAEILIFGPDKVTNGATGDIQQATGLARKMVMEWGMSEKLGRVLYTNNEEEVFLGHSVTQSVNISEETAKIVDEEVRSLIDDGEVTARRILEERIDDLHTLAQGLFEYETLSGAEVADLLEGKPPRRDEPDQKSGGTSSAVPVAGKHKPKKDSGEEPSGGMEPQPQG